MRLGAGQEVSGNVIHRQRSELEQTPSPLLTYPSSLTPVLSFVRLPICLPTTISHLPQSHPVRPAPSNFPDLPVTPQRRPIFSCLPSHHDFHLRAPIYQSSYTAQTEPHHPPTDLRVEKLSSPREAPLARKQFFNLRTPSRRFRPASHPRLHSSPQ